MRHTIAFGFALAACTSPSDPSLPPPHQVPGPVAPGATNGSAAVACDYIESFDASNDYRTNGYEDTGVPFTGTRTTLCGQLDAGHYDGSAQAIDIDNYTIDIDVESDVLVALTGSMQDLAKVTVSAYDPVHDEVLGAGQFVYNHGVFGAHLPVGNFELRVEAYDGTALATSVPYAMTITTDSPATRCAAVTTKPDYTEAHDGTNNRGNDVLAIDIAQSVTMTSTNADWPEPMSLVLDPDAHRRISGISANVTEVGAYLDRDTYLVSTSTITDQLTVRLDWTNTSADLDYFLFPEGSTTPIAVAAHPVLGGNELATFAVAPNTTYWLMIGAYATSAVPAAYNATLCSEMF